MSEGVDAAVGAPAPAEARWGLGDALLGTVLTLVAPSVVVVAIIVATGRDDFDDLALWAVALLQVPLWAGLLGAPLWSTYLKGRRSLADDFGLRMAWRDIPVGLVAGFVGQFALGFLLTVLYEVLDLDADRVGESAEELTSAATDVIGVVLLVLVVAIAAPILEELFYRGLWMRSLQHRLGTGWAVVVSSLVFGLVHFQPYDFPALFGFGVLAALLTVQAGRLGPAIWAHVAFNLTAVISLLADRT